MIIDVENERTYEPIFNGNRELPEAERMRVVHRFLKAGERKKYIYTRPIKMDIGAGTVDSTVEYIQDEEGIVKALVTKIENLEVRDSKTKKAVKVTTGAGLYETAGVPQGLVSEIETYMLGASPEVDGDFLSEP